MADKLLLMSLKPGANIWTKKQQCPCGDWKCCIRNEADDQTATASDSEKSELALLLSDDVLSTPYVGQMFKNDDEAFEYYSMFARKNGFSIRKARSTESPNLGVYRRDFVCHRSGFNQPRKNADAEHHRERKSLRCGCDAKLYLTKEIVDGVPQWYVSQFSNIHNHELLEDDQVRLLPAYRKIDATDQERILLLSKAGFPIRRILKVLELEKGVQPGGLPFIEKDIRNYVRSCKRVAQDNESTLSMKHDNEVMEFLRACKVAAERGDGFVYNFTTDVNGNVENIAWTYGDSVQAFSLFGDVVTFDTSYFSIIYRMNLGMWFGIDNHGRPIFFGCTLLQDETPKSYSWALQVFIRFMGGRRPQVFVTDMDSGLRDALAIELPSTKQVICIWKVLSKMSSWFSHELGMRYSGFVAEFDILSHLENMHDFEHQWNNLVARFGLGLDKHVALLFSYRTAWPLCYVRHFFLAQVMTPEYYKSLETILKDILSAESSLQFLLDKVRVTANIRSSKRQELLYLPTKTCLPVEEHARTVLTPFAFSFLQHEIVLSMQYAVTEMSDGFYLLRHFKKMENDYHVTWIPDDEHIRCSCKEFEHSGILCRHSLRVLLIKNYFQIPEKYFLPRWQLTSSLIRFDDHIVTNSTTEFSQAFHTLMGALFSESFASKERFNYVQEELKRLLDHVQCMHDQIRKHT